MSRPSDPVVTHQHIERAYAQLRRPDWPSLAEMQRWAAQYGVVRGRAVLMAHGQPLPHEPAAAAAPALPQALASARATGQTERLQRRRDDPPRFFDHKRAAAGERPDDE